MPKRKLFYAVDEKGQRVHIDRALRESVYSCPKCKKQVVPRMGDEKIWHFSHIGEHCGIENDKSDDLSNESLDNFATEEPAKIEIGECDDYKCPICREIGKKKSAVKLGDRKYICRECFNNYPSDEINRHI